MQTVIELLEKNYKDKNFISNYRPKSLLNVNYKIILKIFASRLKKSTSESYLISTNCLCCTKMY